MGEVMYFTRPPVQNVWLWKATVNVKQTEEILGLCKEES